MTNHAMFQCAVKVLLYKNTDVLVLFTPDGYIDFPGGRISEGEESIPFKEVVSRELAEELGPDIKYSVGRLAFVSKRRYTYTGKVNHIVALYYNATLIKGDIQLSEEHAHYEWMSVEQLKIQPKHKFQSVDEYSQIQGLTN